MKRYILFAGRTYYPEGGWEDFKGFFDSIEDAKKGFDANEDDWAQIVEDDGPGIILEWREVTNPNKWSGDMMWVFPKW